MSNEQDHDKHEKVLEIANTKHDFQEFIKNNPRIKTNYSYKKTNYSSAKIISITKEEVEKHYSEVFDYFIEIGIDLECGIFLKISYMSEIDYLVYWNNDSYILPLQDRSVVTESLREVLTYASEYYYGV